MLLPWLAAGSPTSVDVKNGVVGVGVDIESATEEGYAVFFSTNGTLLGQNKVGQCYAPCVVLAQCGCGCGGRFSPCMVSRIEVA